MLKRVMLVSVVLVVMIPAAVRSDDKVFTYKVMSLDLALKAAQGALEACRKKGYQVAVAVVDRSGTPQVILRDRFAGPLTVNSAQRKAMTVVNFRTNTIDMVGPTQASQPLSGARHIPGTFFVPGGMLVEAEGSMVGAIAVVGTPSGKAAHGCAKAGIKAITMELMM